MVIGHIVMSIWKQWRCMELVEVLDVWKQQARPGVQHAVHQLQLHDHGGQGLLQHALSGIQPAEPLHFKTGQM